LRFGDISYMERRYRGSIEYRDTYGGVGIVVPISGIAQHYYTVQVYWLHGRLDLRQLFCPGVGHWPATDTSPGSASPTPRLAGIVCGRSSSKDIS